MFTADQFYILNFKMNHTYNGNQHKLIPINTAKLKCLPQNGPINPAGHLQRPPSLHTPPFLH